MKLYLVTSNENKLREVRLLSSENIVIDSIATIVTVREVIENAETFMGNSLKKIEAYKELGVPLLADDSGLVIDSLGGFPGISSARFMEGRDYPRKMEAILNRMKGKEERTARFICAALFYDPSREMLLGVEGKVEGSIALEISGEDGFGYDPIFIPSGFSETFGILGDSVKNELSHRSDAFRKLFSLVSLYNERQ